MVTRAQKPAHFHRAGGSKSVVVPKDFLEAHHLEEGNAIWILTDEGILLAPKQPRRPAIEDEPAFARFLGFLEQAAARHPERLGNVVDLTDRYAHLVEGVEIDE